LLAEFAAPQARHRGVRHLVEDTPEEWRQLSEAWQELCAATQWIQQNTHGMNLPGDNRRMQMAFACLDIAIEHQAGIAVLCDQPFWGSAFALVRPLLDSFIRGIWLARCASDAQAARFEKHGPEKSFGDLVSEAEKALGHTAGLLTRLKRSSWGMMSDFTHTGFQHILRRHSPGALGPSYPVGERVRVMRLATALGFLAMMELAELSGNMDVARSALARAKAIAESGDA
jgi:hypothetical protein